MIALGPGTQAERIAEATLRTTRIAAMIDKESHVITQRGPRRVFAYTLGNAVHVTQFWIDDDEHGAHGDSIERVWLDADELRALLALLED